MNANPTENHVIIEQLDGETKTVGGIYLASKQYENVLEGVVVKVGPGRLLDSGIRREMSVSVGDHVLYHEFSATNVIRKNGKVFHLVQDGDVLAILE